MSDIIKEVPLNENIEQPVKEPKKDRRKRIKIAFLILAAVILIIGFIYLVSVINDKGWFSNQMIAFYIATGVIAAAVISWLILRKTFRTRLQMEATLREDPDIDDWLVIYNITPKSLYFPTIIASFIAVLLLCIPGINDTVIGGLWFAVFFMNFLIEEYDVSIKILMIALISIGFFLLWLHLLELTGDFLSLFKNIAISMNLTVYLLVGILGTITIFISWLKGLFYYISLTPNYMNLQSGPTESGEQIGREDYNTRIDTSDFLERLMGFGRIIITFKDKDKEPISVLVWRIKTKAESLERVRAKFAIDYKNQHPVIPVQEPQNP
jgi:hypothetical protein